MAPTGVNCPHSLAESSVRIVFPTAFLTRLLARVGGGDAAVCPSFETHRPPSLLRAAVVALLCCLPIRG